MPAISNIKCRHCGVAFPSGWGGDTYALADDGRRVVCLHPAEVRRAEEVTGMDWDEAEAAGRIGSIGARRLGLQVSPLPHRSFLRRSHGRHSLIVGLPAAANPL